MVSTDLEVSHKFSWVAVGICEHEPLALYTMFVLVPYCAYVYLEWTNQSVASQSLWGAHLEFDHFVEQLNWDHVEVEEEYLNIKLNWSHGKKPERFRISHLFEMPHLVLISRMFKRGVILVSTFRTKKNQKLSTWVVIIFTWTQNHSL